MGSKMLYAVVANGRICIEEYCKAIHGIPRCPCCDTPLTVKRGTFKAHHFAHSTKQQCEHWTEPMTQWHMDWQLRVPSEQREIRMLKDGVIHIADIQLFGGTVVEVQHSPISVAEVERREKYYDNMVWMVDGRKCVKEGYCDGPSRRVIWLTGGCGWWFRTQRKPVLVDTGDGIVLIIATSPVRGGGPLWIGVDVTRDTSLPHGHNLPNDVALWLRSHVSAVTVKCELACEVESIRERWRASADVDIRVRWSRSSSRFLKCYDTALQTTRYAYDGDDHSWPSLYTTEVRVY